MTNRSIIMFIPHPLRFIAIHHPLLPIFLPSLVILYRKWEGMFVGARIHGCWLRYEGEGEVYEDM
jgi:hypothetical protein